MDAQPTTQFRVLGSIEVEHEGRAVALGPPLQRTLIGVLALAGRHSLSIPELTEALWGDDPPRTATHSLQSYVSGLRAILGRDRLQTTEGGYRLRTDPEEVDAVRFEQLIDAAVAAQGQAEPATALSTLEQALAMWQEPPLAGAPESSWVVAERMRLQELHLRARAAWAEAALIMGRHEDVVAPLESLTRRFPFEERLWHHLLVALHRSGRSADAVQAYERLRGILAEQLGVDPSPALRRLHTAILRDDVDLLGSVALRPMGGPRTATGNPYKGLDHFTEVDAVDFYGRDQLVAKLVERLTTLNQRLLVVIGPSGCGRSSLVHAGLLPALRQRPSGHASRRLTTVTVRPGNDPIGAITGALAREAGRAAPTGGERLGSSELWLVDAVAAQAGPRHDAAVVLVLDQFEEVFALVDDVEERDLLLRGIGAALDRTDQDLRVVVVTRTDHLDRLLSHPSFGARCRPALVPVLPLTADQLARAAICPARRHGITVEPALVTALVADVVGQPGVLPLFQYTLHELADLRADDTISLLAYQAIGGVHGAVTRRAEELFDQLGPAGREAARQVFLRLVHVGTTAEHDLRRRVSLDELNGLQVEPSELQAVLDRFGGARLLRFDRDAATGTATVELAHDALLGAWDRLVQWIEAAREDIQDRTILTVAEREWHRLGQHQDYLLTGARLDRYRRWAGASNLCLTADEQRYLDASSAHAAVLTPHLTTTARWVLAASLTLVALLVAVGVGGAWLERPVASMALLHRDDGTLVDQAMIQGLDRVAGDLQVTATIVAPQTDPAGDIRGLCRAGVELVFLGDLSFAYDAIDAAADCPDSLLMVIDAPELQATPLLPANVLALEFADEEGAFLAGAAAAMTSQTHQIAFLGATPIPAIETYRAGFVAGAMAVAPTTRVTTSYLAGTAEEEVTAAFTDSRLAEQAALSLHQVGNDVILVVAGDAGLGVLDAAATVASDEPRLWVIGVDVDWSVSQPLRRTRHTLTSVVKRVEVAMAEVVQLHLDGTVADGLPRFGLAEGAIDLSHRHERPEMDWQRIEALRDDIVAGRIEVPRSPA
jgi:DNA-binding SARP family transcriptional activator/basic membrane lipoprotein Med (substrate-binding protein (PBP1-ABC) superfamily)